LNASKSRVRIQARRVADTSGLRSPNLAKSSSNAYCLRHKILRDGRFRSIRLMQGMFLGLPGLSLSGDKRQSSNADQRPRAPKNLTHHARRRIPEPGATADLDLLAKLGCHRVAKHPQCSGFCTGCSGRSGIGT
jgi:hypothetical protein